MCYAVDLTDRLTRGLLCHVQWFSTYSRLLSDYMRRDKGIGMDLTLVHHPLFPCFVAANECCGTDNSTTLLPRVCAVEARGSLELESSQSGTKQPVNAQQTFPACIQTSSAHHCVLLLLMPGRVSGSKVHGVSSDVRCGPSWPGLPAACQTSC